MSSRYRKADFLARYSVVVLIACAVTIAVQTGMFGGAVPDAIANNSRAAVEQAARTAEQRPAPNGFVEPAPRLARLPEDAPPRDSDRL